MKSSSWLQTFDNTGPNPWWWYSYQLKFITFFYLWSCWWLAMVWRKRFCINICLHSGNVLILCPLHCMGNPNNNQCQPHSYFSMSKQNQTGDRMTFSVIGLTKWGSARQRQGYLRLEMKRRNSSRFSSQWAGSNFLDMIVLWSLYYKDQRTIMSNCKHIFLNFSS